MSTAETSYDRINDFTSVKISLGASAGHPQLVVWRSQEARDDQLPYLSS